MKRQPPSTQSQSKSQDRRQRAKRAVFQSGRGFPTYNRTKTKQLVQDSSSDVKKCKKSANISSKRLIIDSDDDMTFYTFPSTNNSTTSRKNRLEGCKSIDTKWTSQKVREKQTRNVRSTYQTRTKRTPQKSRSPILAPLVESLSLTHPHFDCTFEDVPENKLKRFARARNLNGRPVNRIPISQYKRAPESSKSDGAGGDFSISQKIVRKPSKSLECVSHLNQACDLKPAKKGKASSTASGRRQSYRKVQGVSDYKDIVVKRSLHYTQIILSTTVGHQKNVLTIQALRELTAVLNNAKYDDTAQVVVITGSDNGTFCSGLDLKYLTTGDIRLAARIMSDTLIEFIRAAVSFPKPLVAVVNGQAIGCGVGLLPICDVVYASDKATFFTPYTQLGQVPDAGLSRSLPHVIGMALANEMLMAGRVLTALEVYQMGLVAQVFWPTSLMQEVIPRITNMATTCSSRVLNATKSLVQSQHRECILSACHSEASMQTEIWCTPECQRSMKAFREHFGSL